jgi:hypothetical protein
VRVSQSQIGVSGLRRRIARASQRGRINNTTSNQRRNRRRALTKEALDKELEEYMMATPETAKKYLNDELDEYWSKAESLNAPTKTNGSTSDNLSSK